MGRRGRTRTPASTAFVPQLLSTTFARTVWWFGGSPAATASISGRRQAHGSTWWAPRARGWWIAVLFAVGSALFVLGAFPSYAAAVGVRWDSATFFLGSLFFTRLPS